MANQKKLVEALQLFRHNGTLLCDEIDMLLHPLRSELNFPIGAKFDLDLAPLRWHFPMFLLNVLLCADAFTAGRQWDDDELCRRIPLAAESTRLKDSVVALVSALDAGYERRALQQVQLVGLHGSIAANDGVVADVDHVRLAQCVLVNV